MSIPATSYLYFLLLLINFVYSASPNEYEEPINRYRANSDDSFRQFSHERVLGELTLDVPLDEQLEYVTQTPLTVESLSRLSLTQFPNSPSSKSSLSELLHIKRTSSVRSFGMDSDESTIKWNGPRGKALSKTSSFCHHLNLPPPISEAPTENVSTTTGTTFSGSPSMPLALKKIFDHSIISNAIVSFLNLKEIRNLASCNRTFQKILNNHETESFNELFPALNGICESVYGLKLFKAILLDENLNFIEWSQQNCLHPDATINLASFIHSRLESAKKANEKFALSNLIEFLRISGWNDYFLTLPTLMQVYFTEGSQDSLTFFVENAISIVMKAAHYGHLRLMKALVAEIVTTFPKIWAQLILNIFLLGTETRNKISWTALQRSVHAPDNRIANYLLNSLTSHSEVLDAFQNLLKSRKNPSASELPSFIEELLFPFLARQKVKRLLQKRMLLATSVDDFRAIHFAVMKSSNLDILRFFLYHEKDLIHNPMDQTEISVLLHLAFKFKSIHSLRLIKRESQSMRIPIEFAIKSDWPLGLMEYDQIHDFILSYKNIFHLIAKHGAINVLKFLKDEILTTEEFLTLSEDFNGNLKRPIDVALEAEKWEVLIFLARNNPKQRNNKVLVKVLEVNASLLDELLVNQHEVEIFAGNSVSRTNHVTFFEWSILSGNQQAFQWFLQRLPRNFLFCIDGIRNTPIHLAVMVGNSEALKQLLDLEPSLLNVKNSLGETPSSLAYRIRDKTSTCNKIFVIDNIIQILAERSEALKK